MWILGFVCCFPAFLFIFLPKFAEIAEICFFGSVKFIRSSRFRKRCLRLWKTHVKPLFFPQKNGLCCSGTILPGKIRACSRQSFRKEIVRWKTYWKTKNFHTREKCTQMCTNLTIPNQNALIYPILNHYNCRNIQYQSTKSTAGFSA